MSDDPELTSNLITDPLASTYPLITDTSWAQHLKYLLLVQHASPSDVCLDVGVANGILAIPLAAKVKAVHGVDISRAMLDACREHVRRAGVTNVRVYERSASDLGFPAGSFDLVFSYSTLLMVPQPQRAFAEIARVVRPGGLAILDITGKYNLSQLYWGRYYRRHGHFGVNAFAWGAARRAFATHGLHVEATHATGILDQWKYVPIVRRLSILERLAHGDPRRPDRDYRVSQRWPGLANRWYFVLRKSSR